MPTRPPTYCAPGQHTRDGDRVRPSARARGYTGDWDKARKAYLAAHPHCVMCRKLDVVTIATVVDHIIPHKGDKRLFWDPSNWQPLPPQAIDRCRWLADSTGRVKSL